jgi:hypothetical protein
MVPRLVSVKDVTPYHVLIAIMLFGGGYPGSVSGAAFVGG